MEVITSDLTLYVDTAGSDVTGTGDIGNPFATPNAAVDWFSNKIISANGDIIVTIQVNDGTYNDLSQIIITSPFSNYLAITGNKASPSNVVLNFISSGYGVILEKTNLNEFSGFKLVGTGKADGRNGFSIHNNSFIKIQNCIVEQFYAAYLGYNFGNIYMTNCTANNNGRGIESDYCSTIRSVNDTMSNNDYGVVSQLLSRVLITGVTYSGNVSNTFTGTGGVIQTY